ncbi:MAG: hypothetical protein ACOCUO_02125 [archaeon]
MAVAHPILEFEDPDREVLHELRLGRCTVPVLVDWTGYDRETVEECLDELAAARFVRKVHDSGLYAFGFGKDRTQVFLEIPASHYGQDGVVRLQQDGSDVDIDESRVFAYFDDARDVDRPDEHEQGVRVVVRDVTTDETGMPAEFDAIEVDIPLAT